MANENAGGIYYEVGADVADLLTGAKQASSAFDDIGSAADKTSSRLRNLDSASRNTGKAVVRAANDSSQAARTMEALGNEIAVLEERNKNGARSAAILSAELRAGAGATASQRKEIGQLTGQLYDLKNAQDKAASSQDRVSAGGGKLEMAMSRVGFAIAGAFTLQAAERIISIADSMSILQARVNRLSPSVEAAKSTMSSLSSIASTTGISLEETEKLWEKLTLSLKEAGATNGQILSLTDTLQKIGTIGGSSGQEMSMALRQFAQSIAGGTIRAEEFNSIIEQTPEIARTMAAGLGISVGELRKRMLEGKLTAEDALNAIMSQAEKVNAEFDKMPVSVERAKNSLDVAFKNVIADLNNSIGLTQTLAGAMQQLSTNLNFFNKNVGDAGRMPKLLQLQKEYTEQVKEAQQWWETQTVYQQRVGQAAFNLKNTEKEIASIRAASAKDQQQNNKPIKISASTSGDDKATQKLEKNTKRKLELSKLEGEARARLQAQYDAEDAGIKDPARIKALQDEYAATEKNTSSRKASNAEGKKTETQQSAINNKLSELQQRSELAAGSTAELSRQQTILRAEQSLGEGATKQQIQLAGELAAKAYDTAAALKSQTEADKARLKVQNDFRQIQKTATPSIAADETYQQQLAAIEKYKVAYPQSIAEAEAARAAIEKQYRDNRVTLMWAEWQQQSEAATVFGEAFDTSLNTVSSSITGLLNGTQSLNEGLANIANTVLSSVVNSFVQMGAEWVKSAIMGQTAQIAATTATTAASVAGTATTTAASTSAAAVTTAAWTPAAIVASIGSFGGAAAIGIGAVIAAMALSGSIAGKRKNGGPVRAGSMYQVGEGGMPEIYQASSGRQYMIPGDNGSVISNKDMMSGSGSSGISLVVYNNIQNNSSASVSSSAQQNADGSLTISTFISDMDNGGPMAQAIGNNFNTQRKANE